MLIGIKLKQLLPLVLDDDLNDDNVDVTITLAVDDASSDDDYDGISTTTIVTNEDDDLPIVCNF